MNLHGKRTILILLTLTMAACAATSRSEPEPAATSTRLEGSAASTLTPTPPTLEDAPALSTNTAPPPVAEQDAAETEVGEVVLQVQTQEGQPAAEGGVMLPAGASISFDSVGRPESGIAGFWRSMDDATFTVLFRNQDGGILSLVELQGVVRWDEEANLIEGEESFLRIQVESGTWLDIVARETLDGQLSLTDENGDEYAALAYGPLFEGTMVKR